MRLRCEFPKSTQLETDRRRLPLQVCVLVHSLNDFLLSTYYMPGTVTVSEETAVSKNT